MKFFFTYILIGVVSLSCLTINNPSVDSQKNLSSSIQSNESRKTKVETEAKAKAETDKIVKEEADKKTKEESDRKAKEKAETEAKAKAETEAKAKAETDKIVKEKTDKKAKEESDRKAKEKAEAEAKVQADDKSKNTDWNVILNSSKGKIAKIKTDKGSGSGFIYKNLSDKSSLLLTNEHVTKSSNNIEVIIDKISYEGKLIIEDQNYDIAVIQICCVNTKEMNLKSITEQDVGIRLAAIGFPLNSQFISITSGLFSSLKITNNLRYIQTDSAINPGNSGGPLIDENGDVIGLITSVVRSASGIAIDGVGFALSVFNIKSWLYENDSKISKVVSESGNTIINKTPTKPKLKNDTKDYDSGIESKKIIIPAAKSLHSSGFLHDESADFKKGLFETNFKIENYPHSPGYVYDWGVGLRIKGTYSDYTFNISKTGYVSISEYIQSAENKEIYSSKFNIDNTANKKLTTFITDDKIFFYLDDKLIFKDNKKPEDTNYDLISRQCVYTSSCEKEPSDIEVEYKINNNFSEFKLDKSVEFTSKENKFFEYRYSDNAWFKEGLIEAKFSIPYDHENSKEWEYGILFHGKDQYLILSISENNILNIRHRDNQTGFWKKEYAYFEKGIKNILSNEFKISLTRIGENIDINLLSDTDKDIKNINGLTQNDILNKYFKIFGDQYLRVSTIACLDIANCHDESSSHQTKSILISRLNSNISPDLPNYFDIKSANNKTNTRYTLTNQQLQVEQFFEVPIVQNIELNTFRLSADFFANSQNTTLEPWDYGFIFQTAGLTHFIHVTNFHITQYYHEIWNDNDNKFERKTWGYIPNDSKNANGNFNLELNVINGKGYFIINNNYVATLQFDDLKKSDAPIFTKVSLFNCYWLQHCNKEKLVEVKNIELKELYLISSESPTMSLDLYANREGNNSLNFTSPGMILSNSNNAIIRIDKSSQGFDSQGNFTCNAFEHVKLNMTYSFNEDGTGEFKSKSTKDPYQIIWAIPSGKSNYGTIITQSDSISIQKQRPIDPENLDYSTSTKILKLSNSKSNIITLIRNSSCFIPGALALQALDEKFSVKYEVWDFID